jgi:hypothetical protein
MKNEKNDTFKELLILGDHSQMQTRSRKNQAPLPPPSAPAARPKGRAKLPAPEQKQPAKPERPIDAKLSVVPGTALPSEFSSLMDAYSFQRIVNYFRKTTKGRNMSEAQLENLTGADFQDVESWLEPGTCCGDFVTQRNEVGRPIRKGTRLLVQVDTNSEILHECVYAHGIVCIHAAVPPIGAIEPDNATQWLVSMVDGSGATVWPPTWIWHDDFDSLASHAVRPASEYWLNTHPLEMNLAPEFLFDVPRPMVRIAAVESAPENLPFSFWLRCEFSDGRGGYSEARLCRPDLVECFSACWRTMKKQRVADNTFCMVNWRDYELCYPRVRAPSSQTMKNPFYWRTYCNQLDEQRRGEAEAESRSVPSKLRSADPEIDALLHNRYNRFIDRRDNMQLTDTDFNDFYERYPKMPVAQATRPFRF